MEDCFDAAYVTLHVRVSNKTAFHLYKNTLGYSCVPPTDVTFQVAPVSHQLHAVQASPICCSNTNTPTLSQGKVGSVSTRAMLPRPGPLTWLSIPPHFADARGSVACKLAEQTLASRAIALTCSVHGVDLLQRRDLIIEPHCQLVHGPCISTVS